MKNKVLVHISVPEIDEEFDIYIPINKKIGNVLVLLNKAINELSDGVLPISNCNSLYNCFTGERYSYDSLVIDTNIRNGSRLVLLT
jgi:hypothetical protein